MFSGRSAELARLWQQSMTGDAGDTDYDTAGVLADRLEEYPEEFAGDSLPQVIAYLRHQFTTRENPWGSPPSEQVRIDAARAAE